MKQTTTQTPSLSYASLLPEKSRNVRKRSHAHEPIAPHPKQLRKRKRVGRGIAAGQGKTCGRGHKGQKARSGYAYRKGFEGGQTPIYRRLPKRGFRNNHSLGFQTVNLRDLARAGLEGDVSPELLKKKALLRSSTGRIKILASGEVSSALQITADAFSKQAKTKLEAAGGSCTARAKAQEKSRQKK